MVISVLLGAVLLLDIFVFLKLFYSFKLLRLPVEGSAKATELPTVSICIPARNETHAMAQCLERVVATEYPKLEIIVLDDGSRDDTSLLIKSFAHAGVRFVGGKPLPDGWLGRNYAQSILAKEASGKLIFFMDVDTLIERTTVMKLVTYMVSRKVKMTSVVPLRSNRWAASTLMTTMRHFWTLMRFRPSWPRAASNACLVDRQTFLTELQTDPSLPMTVQVETVIARKLARTGEYRLIMSDSNIGLSYEKRWSSQVETSIRLLYPQCNMHWYQAAGMIITLSLVLVPYISVFVQPWALVIAALQYVIMYYYLTHVWMRYRSVGALLLPLTVAQEIILVIISTYKYKFGVITWKGRPITATVHPARRL